MKTPQLAVTRTHLAGRFGLLLMLLVAKLSEAAYGVGGADRPGAAAFLARRAIDGIAGIGWATDRLSGRTALSGHGAAAGRRLARPA